MAKEHRIMFRADEALLERVEKLGSKLGLGRGETIRLALDEIIEKYLQLEADIIVVERQKFDAIIKGFSKWLMQEISEEIIQEAVKRVQKSPEIQKIRKAAEEGKLEIEK